jgi:hypothetical protein
MSWLDIEVYRFPSWFAQLYWALNSKKDNMSGLENK